MTQTSSAKAVIESFEDTASLLVAL